MTATSKLGLELLQNGAANQILANTTFATLNQLVQAAVVDKDLSSPPGSPLDEALYIVAASPTGAWSMKSGQLAYWLTSTNAWQFIVPREGMLVHVNDEDVYYKYTGSTWQVFSAGGGGGGGTTQTVAISSGTLDLASVTADTVLVTLTENITSITLPSGATGFRKDLVIRFKQDATGGRTVSLTAFTWESGTPPTIATAANAVTYITASNCDNNGWDGFK